MHYALPAGFLRWLWQQAALPEPYCQQVCMWLLEHTAALEMADEATPGQFTKPADSHTKSAA